MGEIIERVRAQTMAMREHVLEEYKKHGRLPEMGPEDSDGLEGPDNSIGKG